MENEPEQHTPTLSVTVLNYNYAHYLPQCLDSILSQTWKDFELILINDRSTDNSLDVIQRYLADPRVKFINHEVNKGYVASLIEGSELSRGKYITVISADDYCVSDHAFETLLKLMETNDEVTYAYSAYGHYTDNGIRIGLERPHPEAIICTGTKQYQSLLIRGNHILHSGVIIRGTAYKAVGGYDPTVRYAPDTLMWLMLCALGKVGYCADELYAYRYHGSNMSGSKSGLYLGLQESVYGLKKSFDLMRKYPEITEDLYARGVKRYLSGAAEWGIFSGDMRGGWYGYWCAVRIHPTWTIFQIKTVVFLVRTLLGARGYTFLRSLVPSKRNSAVPVAPE